MIREFYGFEDCECGHTDLRTWPAVPSDDRLLCPKCGVARRVKTVVENYRAHVPFSSRKRFTPHNNRSFGCFVESPEHMKHLQEVHGTTDFTPGRVHSDGSCDYTSRDIDTAKAELRENVAEMARESFATDDQELDYDESGNWTVTELGEDE